MRKTILLATLATACLGHAQSDLFPLGQYPQFRTLSGLPGGGFGVDVNGNPSFKGAMSMATPIGYGLSNYHWAIVASNTSDNELWRFPHLKGHSGSIDSNGKLAGMLGVRLGQYGSLTGAAVINSSVGDESYNFQYQTPVFFPKLGVSVGVQDLAGHRGAGAENVTNGNQNSQSWFFASTYELPLGIHVSGGLGTKRFSKGFGSADLTVNDKFKVVLEHDGFNFNEALAYDLGHFLVPGLKKASSSLMLGYVRSKYAFASINIAF